MGSRPCLTAAQWTAAHTVPPPARGLDEGPEPERQEGTWRVTTLEKGHADKHTEPPTPPPVASAW